jgi:hypothetical protein
LSKTEPLWLQKRKGWAYVICDSELTHCAMVFIARSVTVWAGEMPAAPAKKKKMVFLARSVWGIDARRRRRKKNRVFLARFDQFLRLALTVGGYAPVQTQRLGLRPSPKKHILVPAAAGTKRKVFLPGF